jgi:hypothetical protein
MAKLKKKILGNVHCVVIISKAENPKIPSCTAVLSKKAQKDLD